MLARINNSLEIWAVYIWYILYRLYSSVIDEPDKGCRLYSEHCTVYSVQCNEVNLSLRETFMYTLYTVHYTYTAIHCCIVYSVHCTAVYCRPYSVHCTLYTVVQWRYISSTLLYCCIQLTQYTVHCTLHNVQLFLNQHNLLLSKQAVHQVNYRSFTP